VAKRSLKNLPVLGGEGTPAKNIHGCRALGDGDAGPRVVGGGDAASI